MTCTASASLGGGTRWRVACLLLVVASVSAQAQRGAKELYTPEDLLFLRHMIVHHEQAVTIALLARDGTTDPAIRIV